MQKNVQNSEKECKKRNLDLPEDAGREKGLSIQIEGGNRKWIIRKNMKNGCRMITLTGR